jgi:hypothetical protein
MSAIAPSLSYYNSGVTAGVQVGPRGPRGLYGIISTVTGGAVTIYDNTSAAGTILFTKTLAVGDVIHFGGLGIRAKNGLFLVVAAGTVNVLYV